MTFFAGTFVRHPLALAAMHAVLQHLKEQGPALQERIAKRAADLAATLNGIFAQHGLKAKAECYSSFLYFSLHAEVRSPGCCSITCATAAFTFRTDSRCS